MSTFIVKSGHFLYKIQNEGKRGKGVLIGKPI